MRGHADLFLGPPGAAIPKLVRFPSAGMPGFDLGHRPVWHLPRYPGHASVPSPVCPQVDAEGGGDSAFRRVGGTACGGATFLGLCRALTGETDFAALIAMAEKLRLLRVYN